MSNWQVKSNSSITAANNLISDELFNPSIHSFYYACVQYVYHVFEGHFGFDIEQIEKGSVLVRKGGGNHVWLRKQIFDSLKNKDKIAAAKFHSTMGQLCNKRVLADYHYQICEASDANNSKKTAEEIINVLKTFYI